MLFSMASYTSLCLGCIVVQVVVVGVALVWKWWWFVSQTLIGARFVLLVKHVNKFRNHEPIQIDL